jgi:biotin carboxylase
MATPEDINSNAEYIRMADQYEEVPGGSNHNNYANVDLIVAIAERTGVDAVWAVLVPSFTSLLLFLLLRVLLLLLLLRCSLASVMAAHL